MWTSHAPAKVLSSTERFVPNGVIAAPCKPRGMHRLKKNQQLKMRRSKNMVKSVSRESFVRKEAHATAGGSGRVQGHIFTPLLPGFDIHKMTQMDGSKCDASGREVIYVEGSTKGPSGWKGTGKWHVIERFAKGATKMGRIEQFVRYQSEHYDDLRTSENHFGWIGGAGLRAWNATIVGEYSPISGPCKIVKAVSRFRLHGAATEMRECFCRSYADFAGLVYLQSRDGPIKGEPYFFAWSKNLANAMHLDTSDMYQSFATFVTSKDSNPEAVGYKHVTGGGEVSWWLLFPVNGVAVKLEDGVGVTW